MNFHNILSQIEVLKKQQKTVVIAIDGRSGAGKSTIANELKEHISKSQIISLDQYNLYSGSVAVEEFRRNVLEPLKYLNGEECACYIIEGIFALSTQLRKYYDLKIWVECSVELGFKRGLERDIALNGFDNSEQWESYWLPLEQQYIQDQKPADVADIVLNST